MIELTELLGVDRPIIALYVIGFVFDDLKLKPRLTRQDYSVKVLSDQFQSKPAEIKRFLSGQLEPARTRELVE